MNQLSFKSENLIVDWLSFNIKGLLDSRIIASDLSKHFTVDVTIDNKPSISYDGFKTNYKVSIR